MIGPRLLVTPVQAQMPMIEQFCQDARGPVREDVLRVGTRYAEFLGWLYQDSGDPVTAMKWTNHALDYAQELDDLILTSYIQQRRSNIATEAGRPGNGLGFANAALCWSRQLPPSIQAVALRQLANAHALLEEAEECGAEALDRARELAARADPSDPTDMASYCTVSYVDMEAANCAVLLRRPDDAVQAFRASLAQWPDGQETRRRTLLCPACHRKRDPRRRGVGSGVRPRRAVRRPRHGISPRASGVVPAGITPRAMAEARRDCRTGQDSTSFGTPEPDLKEHCVPAADDHHH